MMKRLAVILALVPMLASASDLTPGTFELTGGSTLGFNSGSVKEEASGGGSQTTDTTQYGLDAAGLYYVIPNLGVGLSLAYDNSKAKLNGIEAGTSQFTIGPAVSYEVPIAAQFAAFGRGTVGYVSETLTRTGTPDVSASGFGLALEAGVKYFLVRNFSFDVGLGYKYASVKDDQTPKITTSTSNFGLNLGLSVYFGGTGH